MSKYEISFITGNCPVLAARGTLNQFNCSRNFSHGCPETNFYSEELYKCMFIYSLKYFGNFTNNCYVGINLIEVIRKVNTISNMRISLH